MQLSLSRLAGLRGLSRLAGLGAVAHCCMQGAFKMPLGWPFQGNLKAGPRAGLQVLQNSGSQMFMLRVETLSAVSSRLPLEKLEKREKRKRWQQYKSALVSPLTSKLAK